MVHPSHWTSTTSQRAAHHALHAMASLPQFWDPLNSFHGPINYYKAFQALVHSHAWEELHLLRDDDGASVDVDLVVFCIDSSGLGVQVKELLLLALKEPEYGAPGIAKLRPARLCAKATAEHVMQSVQPTSTDQRAGAVLLRHVTAAPLKRNLRHGLLRLARIKQLPEPVLLEVPLNLQLGTATASSMAWAGGGAKACNGTVGHACAVSLHTQHVSCFVTGPSCPRQTCCRYTPCTRCACAPSALLLPGRRPPPPLDRSCCTCCRLWQRWRVAWHTRQSKGKALTSA
jgi:hypothetical protein